MAGFGSLFVYTFSVFVKPLAAQFGCDFGVQHLFQPVQGPGDRRRVGNPVIPADHDLDGAIRLNLAVFRDDYDNVQRSQILLLTPTTIGTVVTNATKARLTGAEAELDVRPTDRLTFSEKFACPVSGFTIAEIEPRLFSFNAPQGACPACDGLGEKLYFDPRLMVPNEALSIQNGAVVPWARSQPPTPTASCGASRSSTHSTARRPSRRTTR